MLHQGVLTILPVALRLQLSTSWSAAALGCGHYVRNSRVGYVSIAWMEFGG